MAVFGRKKSQKQHVSHPDPAVEIKLRGIAAIDHLRYVAFQRIKQYQHDIDTAQDDITRALRHLAGSYITSYDLNQINRMSNQRIKNADDGIKAQHTLVIDLNAQIEKAIADAGLTDSDLAYLDLQ